MLIIVTSIILNVVRISGNKKPIAKQLTYPLTNIDSVIVRDYGFEFVDGLSAFLNGGSFNDWAASTCPNSKWNKKMMNIVDGVIYSSWRQFQKYILHTRNLFIPGSFKITNQPTTTILDIDKLEIYFCFQYVLDLDIAGYNASKKATGCYKRIQTFDKNMELISAETITDGGVARHLLTYVLQSTVTTILPDDEYQDDDDEFDLEHLIKEDRSLLRNPIFISLVLIIAVGTLLIGIVIGCVIRSSK